MNTNPSSLPTASAHLGVTLVLDGTRGVIAHPAADPGGTVTLQPVRLPRIHSQHLYLYLSAVQAHWQDTRCAVVMLLYVDVMHRCWRAVVPRQTCSTAGAWCRLNSSDNPLPMRATERLAGSILTQAVVGNPSTLPDDVPGFDGVHVITELTAGQSGFSLWPFYRCGGEVIPIELDNILLNNGRAWLAGALDQLHLAAGEHGHDDPQ